MRVSLSLFLFLLLPFFLPLPPRQYDRNEGAYKYSARAEAIFLSSKISLKSTWARFANFNYIFLPRFPPSFAFQLMAIKLAENFPKTSRLLR